ncbi:hypothetical protein [Haloglycomyces albus]|uniref:hypothetical protein n=1 Tax=Haloglycomyces albus TaxID=526067 RepID=UPI00046D05F4|nr:hypothetical protein [Haloglycomyces albus]
MTARLTLNRPNRLLAATTVVAFGTLGLTSCGDDDPTPDSDASTPPEESASEDYSEEVSDLVEDYYTAAFEEVQTSLYLIDGDAAADAAEPYLCESDLAVMSDMFAEMPEQAKQEQLDSLADPGDFELEVHIMDAYAYAGAGNVEAHILYNDPSADGERVDVTHNVSVLENDSGTWEICGMFEQA